MSEPEKLHPVTAEHLQALGRISIAYSYLEWQVSGFIWRLVAADQRIGQTITAGLMLSARIDLLRALFSLLPGYEVTADVERLYDALNRARQAGERRNSVVHALLWSADEGGALSYSKLQRAKPAHWVRHEAQVADLAQVAEALEVAAELVAQCEAAHFRVFEQEPQSWFTIPYGTLYTPSVEAAIAGVAQYGLPPSRWRTVPQEAGETDRDQKEESR